MANRLSRDFWPEENRRSRKAPFKAISDDQRIRDVSSGAVDIVAHTMTITCDRLQMVDFSSVYFDAAQRVLVLKNSAVNSERSVTSIPVELRYGMNCAMRKRHPAPSSGIGDSAST